VAGAAALDSFIADVASLSASFDQEIWSADSELLEQSTGRMSLARPNRFYWHQETPPELVVVADGAKLWTYDVELAQVTVTPLDSMGTASPALLLSGDERWRDAFEVTETYRLDSLDWVKLVPRAVGADFSSLLIAFDAGRPEVLEIVDGLEQTTRLRFADVVVNDPVDDGLFEFALPPGVDVIGGGH